MAAERQKNNGTNSALRFIRFIGIMKRNIVRESLCMWHYNIAGIHIAIDVELSLIHI